MDIVELCLVIWISLFHQIFGEKKTCAFLKSAILAEDETQKIEYSAVDPYSSVSISLVVAA
jgi:hypothetical protein